MSNFYLPLLLAGLCALADCHHVSEHHDGHDHDHQDGHGNHESKASPWLKLAPHNTDFAFKFYHQVASEASGKNIFFSPLSISTAFALLSMGARSTTLNQVLSVLGFNQSDISQQDILEGYHHLLHMLNCPKSEVQLSTGNALFTHEEIELLQTFVDDAKLWYQAEVCPAPFSSNSTEAIRQINSYIEKKTHGKLVDVVKSLDPTAVMVIVNYIFLKAYWEKPFSIEVTREADFFVNANTTVKVSLMNRNGFYESYHDNDLSCDVVKIPYKGNAAALFVLPARGKAKLVEDALGKDTLSKWKTSLKRGRLDLYIPRVTISGSYDVKATLERLGVTDVFSNQADLSGITKDIKLKVSQAIHKAHLNIHENGTEAAAATVVEVVPMSLPSVLRFDSPFLLFILSEENILFMGKIENPTEK